MGRAEIQNALTAALTAAVDGHAATFVVEGEERPSIRINRSTCWKIGYDNRSDTAVIVPEGAERADHRRSRACATFWNPARSSA